MVFFDPPYSAMEFLSSNGDLWRCLQRLLRPDITSDRALLVLRSPKETAVDLPAGWTIAKELTVASMRITLAEKVA